MRGSPVAALSVALVACGSHAAPSTFASSDASAEGSPTVLATVGSLGDLEVDGTNVYFTDFAGLAGTTHVYSVPVAGGPLTTLGTPADAVGSCGPGAIAAAGLAQDDANVYFLDGINVGSIAKAGGPVAPLVSLACGGVGGGLRQSGGSLFWMQVAGDAPELDALKLAGTATMAVISQLPLGSSGATAIDGTSYYFSGEAGVLQRVPLAGGTSTVLMTDPLARLVTGVAVDGTYAYVALSGGCASPIGGPPCPAPSPTTSAIVRVPLGGGAAMTIATDYDVAGIAVDGVNVYWIDPYDSVKWTPLPAEGSSPIAASTLAEDPAATIGPVVDAEAVYWGSGASIARIAKPR